MEYKIHSIEQYREAIKSMNHAIMTLSTHRAQLLKALERIADDAGALVAHPDIDIVWGALATIRDIAEAALVAAQE